jgi:hypothetical protein
MVYNWFKPGLKLGDTVADGEYCGGQIGDMVACHGYCGVQLADNVACGAYSSVQLVLQLVVNWFTTSLQLV